MKINNRIIVITVGRLFWQEIVLIVFLWLVLLIFFFWVLLQIWAFKIVYLFLFILPLIVILYVWCLQYQKLSILVHRWYACVLNFNVFFCLMLVLEWILFSQLKEHHIYVILIRLLYFNLNILKYTLARKMTGLDVIDCLSHIPICDEL